MIGGAGGKLDGQKFDRVQSKSKNVEQGPSEKTKNPITAEHRETIATSGLLFKKFGDPKDYGAVKFKEKARSGELDHLWEIYPDVKMEAQKEKDAAQKAAEERKKEKNSKWKEKNLPKLAAAKKEREEKEREDHAKKVEAAKSYLDDIQHKSERKYLYVPFERKDMAKASGAKWDADSRRWYMPHNKEVPDSLTRYQAKPSSSSPEGEGQSSGRRTINGMPTSGRISENDPSIYGSELLGHEGERWEDFHARHGRDISSPEDLRGTIYNDDLVKDSAGEYNEADYDYYLPEMALDGFTYAQFLKGFKAEQEHLDSVDGDEETIISIIIDHLKEDPEYYSKLAEIE